MKGRSHSGSIKLDLEIEKLVYGGWGFGRHEGKVVFVPFTTPGDRVEVRPRVVKKNYIRASLIRILEPGSGRQIPPCRHFGSCGGCHWQHIEYARQVDAKRQVLEEILTHRFPQTGDLLMPMRASLRSYEYRSRARFQLQELAGEMRVGFFRFHTHDVEDIEMCPLLRPTLNDGLAHIRGAVQACPKHAWPRHIDAACAEEDGRWAAAETEPLEGQGLPGEEDPAAPAKTLVRTVGIFQYRFSPSVFFQANDFAVGDLVDRVSALARECGGSAALELFAGVGLFTLPLALTFASVTAVESSEAASRFCKENAAQAGLDNVRTHCADVLAWMGAAGSLAPPALDLVLLDPPRTGAGREIMRRIAEWSPETIIYVSCDPQTLARDLAALPIGNYQIDHLEGFDLFPQTYHFETVARLRRR